MEADVAVLADAANVSTEGKLNVCGIFRTLRSAAAPITWPSCVLVLEFLLRGEEIERMHTLRVRLMGPGGQPLREFPPMTFGGGGEGAGVQTGLSAVAVPLTFNIAHLSVSSFGLYRFDLLVNDEEAVSVEAEVVQA